MAKKYSRNISLLIIGVILLAANLRAPIVSVGPVTSEMILNLGISPTIIGLITTIPLLCFAFGSVFMPRFSARLGIEKALLFSVLFLMIGVFIRSAGNYFLLFLGSLIIGVMITVANVLMPPFIKKYFSGNAGFMTALFLSISNIFAALSVAFSVEIGEIANLGWKSSIGIWGFFSLFALPVWWFIFKHKKESENTNKGLKSPRKMWSSNLAWQISIFMGMQSVIYYVLSAWLPTILQHWGMKVDESGIMVFYIQMSTIPMMFVGSLLAGKVKYLKRLVWFASVLMFSGILLFIIWETHFAILASIFTGTSIGLVFSLSTMFFVVKTEKVSDSVQLSGMAQTVGYFIAGCFPPLVGFLFQVTQSWVFPLWILLIIPIIMCMTGLLAAKDKVIHITD